MSSDTSTRKLTRMGRRRFLGALSTLGVSGAALQHLSKEALADLTADPSAEVPRLERLVHANHEAVAAGEEPPEREAEYYTIPRDEWVHVEATQDAMRRLDRKLNRLTSSDLVSVSVGTTVSGQQSERAVFVTHAERDGETADVGFDELRDALPATITGTAGKGPNAEVREGIRVIPERGTAGEDHGGEDGGEDSNTCDTYDHLYRDPGIPAGALIRDGCCTAGTPAYDNDESEYCHTTAAHCFDTYDYVYQPSSSYDAIGYVDEKKETGYFDAGKIDVYNGSFDLEYDFASDYGDNEYRDLPIWGIISWDRIKDGVDDLYLSKQGASTAISGGYVQRIYESSSDPNGKYFETGGDRDGGDSGGPHYKRYNDFGGEAYIAGLHEGWKSSSSYAGATAMEGVEDEFNLDV